MSADSPNKPPPADPIQGAAKPVRQRSGKVLIPAVLLLLVGLLNLLAALGFVAMGYGILNSNPSEVERGIRNRSPEAIESLRKAGWYPASIQFYATFVF